MTSVLDEHKPGTLAPLSRTELGHSMSTPLLRIKGRRHQEEAVRFAQEVLDDLLRRGIVAWSLNGDPEV